MTDQDKVAWDQLVSMCGGDMMLTKAFADATILVADAELKRLREEVLDLMKMVNECSSGTRKHFFEIHP